MTALLEAAKAIIPDWDTPSWKDVPVAGVYINALRDAVAGVEAQFQPDWANYQQGVENGRAEALDLIASHLTADQKAALVEKFGEPVRQTKRLPVALRRDDTEHGVYYYRSNAVDAMLAADAQEIERLQSERDSLGRTKLSDKDAYEALRAELDRLKQQDPAGHIYARKNSNVPDLRDVSWAGGCMPAIGAKLYLAAGAQQVAATCTWTHDDDTGAYDTQCGGFCHLNEGTPEDHGAKFCPYCGGGIVVKEES